MIVVNSAGATMSAQDTSVHPLTRLLQLRQQSAEVDELLQAAKQKYKIRMDAVRARQLALDQRELETKQTRLGLEKFLIGNETRRKQAIIKRNDTIELMTTKDKEIARLQGELEDLEKVRDARKRQAEKNSVYVQYMNGVVSTVDEFHELRDIMSRHQTLSSTRQDLVNQLQKNLELIEEKKTYLAKYLDEKNDEVIKLNFSLSALQMSLEKAELRVAEKEMAWADINTTADQKSLLIGRIRIATDNLHQMIRQFRRHSTDDRMKFDTTEQLVKIQQYIQDLQDITGQRVDNTKKRLTE